MRSARLPRLRGGVCELVMISRVYDDPDEPYGPASAVPSRVRTKPRPLQDPHSSRALRARLNQSKSTRSRPSLTTNSSRNLPN
jgi:hypothetical protein